MDKKILIAIISAFILAMPAKMNAQDVQRPAIEQEMKEISISVSTATLHIKNADKMTAEIYNMAGVKVASLKVDSPDKTFDLSHLQKGIYIVRVGKVARKVYIH